jgi:hypothetical protein
MWTVVSHEHFMLKLFCHCKAIQYVAVSAVIRSLIEWLIIYCFMSRSRIFTQRIINQSFLSCLEWSLSQHSPLDHRSYISPSYCFPSFDWLLVHRGELLLRGLTGSDVSKDGWWANPDTTVTHWWALSDIVAFAALTFGAVRFSWSDKVRDASADLHPISVMNRHTGRVFACNSQVSQSVFAALRMDSSTSLIAQRNKSSPF